MKTNQLTLINKDYAKNETAVFWRNIALPNSDPATFKVIAQTAYFAADKNQVYALSGCAEGIQIWDDVDIESVVFFPPGNPYFADKNHLYYFNWHFINYENHELEREQSDLTIHFFRRWKDGESQDTGLTEIQKAEVIAREGTFKRYLNHHHPNKDAWWGRDEAYYKSLIKLKNNIYVEAENVYIFIDQDDLSVAISTAGKSYFSIIPNADLASFQSLDNYYSKDKNSVFYYQRRLKQADLSTFASLGNNFAKDKNGVFYNGHLCKEADKTTFQVINADFARDKTQLFATTGRIRIGKFKGYDFLLRALKDSDPDSFEVLNDRWAKDNKYVYCGAKIWKGIDAATFHFLFEDGPDSWAKCKFGLYNANGRRTMKDIDGESFEILSKYWGKDKNAVFNFITKRITSTIDVQSFKISEDIDNQDGSKAYDKKYDYSFDEYYSIKKKIRKIPV